jgi:hypothetical protein
MHVLVVVLQGVHTSKPRAQMTLHALVFRQGAGRGNPFSMRSTYTAAQDQAQIAPFCTCILLLLLPLRRYCCKACQVEHWKWHKALCKKLSKPAAAAAETAVLS